MAINKSADHDLSNFKYEDREKGTEIRDVKNIQSKLDKTIVTRIDLPLNLPYAQEFGMDELRMKEWIEKELKGKKLEKKETREYIQKLLQDSVLFLENELEISIPRVIIDKIKTINQSSQNILNFVRLSYGVSGNKTIGIMVCAILKVANTIHYFKQNPALHDLGDKTKKFGNLLAKKGNTGFKTGEELENATKEERDEKGNITSSKQKISISFPTKEGLTNSFVAKEIYLKTKTAERMIAKLLRKPELDASEIIKDGIRGRIIVNSKAEKNIAILWLESLGFELKKTTTTSSGKVFKDNVVSMIGTFRRNKNDAFSIVEMQVSDEESLKKAESGVYSHKVFGSIQKFLVLTRLFSSISDQRMKQEIERLHKTEKINRKALENRFQQFFFKQNTEIGSGRWYAYDYEFRIREKGIYPQNRFEKTLVSFLRDFSVQEEFSKLKSLSLQNLHFIFENIAFPSSMSKELCELFLKFLDTKEGIPSGIKKILKEQLITKNLIKKIYK